MSGAVVSTSVGSAGEGDSGGDTGDASERTFGKVGDVGNIGEGEAPAGATTLSSSTDTLNEGGCGRQHILVLWDPGASTSVAQSKERSSYTAQRNAPGIPASEVIA